jgi:hypothetical protein
MGEINFVVIAEFCCCCGGGSVISRVSGVVVPAIVVNVPIIIKKIYQRKQNE